MIQPRFLLSVAIIVALISINCNNCNAGITRIGSLLNNIDSFELDDDIDSFELDDRGDLKDPIMWLKRQVRKLKKALVPIREDIAANKEDIEENAEAIAAGGGAGGSGNITALEEALDSALDMIAENAGAIANNTDDIADNAGMIANNTIAIQSNYDLLAEEFALVHRHYLTFGGFDKDGKSTDFVYLVDLNVFGKTSTACNHSSLPVALKESHVYEFNDTLLVCTTFTEDDMAALQCFIWDVESKTWETFDTPATSDKVHSFIDTVRIPGVGIWFTSKFDSGTGNYSLVLHENGTWSTGLYWPISRTRACILQIDDERIAHIGGTPGSTGQTIDTYNFITGNFTTNVTQMHYNRKMHSCALIPKGPNGNPTVAILGDNSAPLPFEMELWDTVTNEITLVPHPTGYEDTRFFRPIIVTFDDDSIFLAGGKTIDDAGETIGMDKLFQYKVGEGWIDLGGVVPELTAKTQHDIYFLDNPELGAYASLMECQE